VVLPADALAIAALPLHAVVLAVQMAMLLVGHRQGLMLGRAGAGR